MSLIVANRIQETCISPGTGPVALLGAAIQYVSFSSKLSNGDTTFYVIADAVGTNWEVGIGTYASSGNTLARTTVLSSSNSGSLVNFSSGTQNVWNDYPAEYAIYASNNASQASGQSLISSGVGTPPTWGNPVAPSGSPGYYGQFYDTTTQTAASTTVDYLIGCATTSISNGISISSGRITVANAGIYNFQFSLQLANSTSTIATTTVWVRYNGVDVANSASSVGVPIKHGSVNGLMLLALNQVFNMAAGDYIELWWQSDVAGVTIATIPSTSGPTVPQSPAVIYTMTQQAQIGIGYSGLTSTTSTLIGTGSKVFTTNLTSTQTAFSVGTRVRVAYSVTPANFMEGVVTAFSSTTFTVNVDSIGGSGTFASWTVSVAGIQGSNGVTSFSGNSTGLTPSTATTGAISLAGTLNVANGGTGATTLTGVLKGNGTGAFTTATSGTDYSAGTSALATGILKSTTSTGALSIAIAGTDYQTAQSVTGVVKSSGTTRSAATAGTDYSAGTSALTTGILKSTTTTGALTIAVAADFPTLNQNTTGTAANLSGTPTLPSGTTLVAPVLGTPASGNLSNCTFPTLNQNTTGTAAGLSATLAIASGGTNSSATPTAGGSGYGTGTAHAYTAAGTTGQVLTSQGAGAPIWSPAATGTVTSVAALTLGTTGTDVSSTVANGTTTPVITLNLPTASASNRGALSSTDWSAFNGKLSTTGGTMTGAITFASGQTVDGTNGIGYINIPQNSQSAAYTLVAADAGKHIFHPSTDANARTFTIPANGSVAYPIGTAISFVNMTSQVVSIAITTDTMYLAGTGTTGTRSLAQYGTATALKMTSTTWIISGAGLT